MARGGGRKIRSTARKATRSASPWIEGAARAGYAAYGTVYLLVGALALQAAFSGGGKTASQEGALQTILLAPLGRILLGLVALGLLGYGLWRVFQGTRDPENDGSDAKGIAKRAKHAADGLFHAALAVGAFQVALGSGGGGGGGGPDDWTATLLQQPFGRFLTVAVGAVIVGVGLYQFYLAYAAKFMEGLQPGEMGARQRAWARRSGRLGYAARGVVFIVIGSFLVLAALQTNPNQARGLGGALSALASQPFGPYLLGTVALGLICYGLFMFVVAWYRRIDAG